MGTFRHEFEIAAGESGPFVAVEAVVDTGAAYTWIPGQILRALGVAPRGSRRFVLADGRVIEREIAVVAARLDGQTLPTLCVIGDDDSLPLLGSVTLEEFGLAADPVNQRLVPLPLLYLLGAVYPTFTRLSIPTNARQNAGRSGGVRDEIRLPSTTTS